MPGNITIFATAVVAVASVSGVALGNYATTTKQPVIDATDIRDHLGNPSASYDTEYASQTTDMAPAHVPVCRKGCGPTLSERQAAAYFDDGYTQLDKIYEDGDKDHWADTDPYTNPGTTADPVAVPAPPTRLTLAASEPACLSQDDLSCSGPTPHIN
ncbi:MAG: hypothetical protein QHC67_03355 [Sphingobium sp.]|uniref:hypothetical protein n=1 Tax=Sphingobium sp. TaxID=1912891 RepID=UPI0029B7989C|nr:hypothetical protein [Sphingobium sp.]MDX3908835.1 hypothetical protein [Sphingobium sp.]